MKVAVVLTEGFADWECALLMASARSYFGFEIVTTAPGGRPVMSMGGLKVTPDRAVEDVVPDAFDALVISGGMIWKTEAAPDLSALIRSFHGHGRVVGAICAATLALARAGVLDAVAHTSNDPDFLKDEPNYRGEALYLNVRHAVRDDGIVTAAGTSPVTFTAEIYHALGFTSADLDREIRLFGAEHQQIPA